MEGQNLKSANFPAITMENIDGKVEAPLFVAASVESKEIGL